MALSAPTHTSAALGGSKQTPLYVHIAAMMLFVLPCIAVSQFTAHLENAVLDDHLFAYFGWRIWNGAALYVDVWDHKPPGMFWLNALGFLIGGAVTPALFSSASWPCSLPMPCSFSPHPRCIIADRPYWPLFSPGCT